RAVIRSQEEHGSDRRLQIGADEEASAVRGQLHHAVGCDELFVDARERCFSWVAARRFHLAEAGLDAFDAREQLTHGRGRYVRERLAGELVALEKWDERKG